MINSPGSDERSTGDEGSAMAYAAALKRTQVGADWFFWIAGFSLISSVVILTGHSYYPAVGLGTTELISAVVTKPGAAGQNSEKILVFVFDLLAAGFYVLYGVFGRKGAKWALITGMVFYALDAVLLLVGSAWLSVAFHAYAVFRIFQGFQAAQQLGVLQKQQANLRLTRAMPASSAASSDVWPPPPSA